MGHVNATGSKSFATLLFGPRGSSCDDIVNFPTRHYLQAGGMGVAGESFTKTRGEPTPEAKAYREGMLAGQKLGEQEGRVKERALLLDQLEQRYMGETVERDSPLGDAILK